VNGSPAQHSAAHPLCYDESGETPTIINHRQQKVSTQMNRIFSSAAALVLLSFATFDAQAMPLAPAPAGSGAPDVTLVEGGCGPGAHRDGRGFCRPNGGPVVVLPGVVVAPAPGVVVVGPQVCGPGLRWHPGRRRCWAY
jgi:hypothetical protein